MASGTLPPPVAPPRASRAASKAAVPSDFIDQQIGKTRAYVKSVDIAHGLLSLATGVVAYLLAMAVVDHWLVPGGLGTFGRTVAFLAVVGGSAWHLVRTLLPLVMLKINPLYAAQTIEQCQPSFKNSLLSVLQLRQQRDAVPEAVYNSVEAHAATRLATVTVESTVDRSGLIRIGYVMLGVLIAAALYYLASPKDALATAGRVLMPWADIAAPTRVTINDVKPGEATVIRGQQVDVSAEVAGLREDEVARVVYSSDDGQIVDRELPMRAGEGGYRHAAKLPPGDERLQGNVTYRVEAGDARSPTYRVTVEPTPTIDVESVHYDYPEYTAPILQDKRVEGVGDVRAVEGTRVTIRCRANQPIGRATIDFGCDGKDDATMKVGGDQALVTFELKFADRVNLVPEHASYQVKFYNKQGVGNPAPVQHTIEVLPDLPPEVAVERPAEALIEVPEDEAVEFRATARDADFKLSEVALKHEGRAGQREPASLPLLAAEKAPWQGKFDAPTRKSPRELGYRAGDEIRYWIEAVDNKTPIDTANRVSTRPATIRVLAPLRPEEKPKPDPNAERKPQDDPKSPDQPNEKQPPPDKNPGEQNAEPNADPSEKEQPGEKAEPKEDGAGNESQKKDEEATTKGEDGASGDNAQEKEQNGGKPNGDQQKGDQQNGKQGDDPGEKQQPNGQGGAGQNANGDNQGNAQQRPGGKEGPGKREGQPNGADKGGTGGQPGGADDSANQTPERRTPAGDAEAIKELLKDRQNQAGAQPGDKTGDARQENSDPSAAGSPNDRTTDQAPSSEQPASGVKPNDNGKGPKPEEKTEEPRGAGGPQGEDNPEGGNAPKEDAGMNEGMGDESRNPQSDKNDKPGGNAKPEATEEKPDGKKGDKDSPGPGLGDPGPGSTGRPDKTDTPSPEGQESNKPQHKPGNQNDDNAKPSNDPAKSPNTSPKQSQNSTKGENQGHESGDGAAGGGQDAKQPGKGSAGTQQSSDTGGNASKEQGKDTTGDKAGDGVEAEGKTGNSLDERGAGSAGKPKSEGARKPGDKGTAGNGDSDPNADARDEDLNPTGKPGKNPGGGRLNPGGGQAPGDPQDAAAEPPPAGPEKEDPADLEYAKKATDLALEHLRDRMKQGDEQELLDKLKWTREDAERFLTNWDQIKREAGTSKADAEKRLHEELKSLGLRRGGASFNEGQAAKDNQRALQQGANVPTPAEFQDRQRAYRVGTGR